VNSLNQQEDLSFLNDLPSEDQIAEERSWHEFLRRYSPLLRHIAHKLTLNRDTDDTEDIFLYIIEHLYENNYACLRQYSGLSRFSTWLGRVSYNLGVDSLRERFGRRRLYESIKSLERDEQRIFELYYWEGYSQQEICEMLSSEFKREYSLNTVIEKIESIEENISSKKKWQLLIDLCRNKPHLSLSRDDWNDDSEDKEIDFPDIASEPQTSIETLENEEELDRAIRKLNDLINNLSSTDQIILKGYYLDGMKIREISLITDIPEKNLYRRLSGIKDRLKEELKSIGIGEELMSIILTSIVFFLAVVFEKHLLFVRI